VTPYVFSVLTQMGLKVTLNQQTGNQFWNTLLAPALGYDLAIAGWGPDYDDPYTYMQYWQTSSTDMGTTFNNADYDKLLQQANNETDLKKRAQILAQAEALFSDIGTSIPLLHYKGEAALQPSVRYRRRVSGSGSTTSGWTSGGLCRRREVFLRRLR
jgi:oligopeptide transport system substrate-binding protein